MYKMPPSPLPRRPRRRPARKGRFHGVKHSNMAVNAGQFARVVDTIQLANEFTNTPYSINTKASQFDRVSALFNVYKYYRIVEIQHEWRPLANMSQVNAHDLSGALSNMFALTNTSGIQPLYFNPTWLQAQGCKPRLFNKSINIKYKPKTLIATNNSLAGTDTATTAQSCLKWLPTQRNTSGATSVNSDVEYYGLLYEFEHNTPGAFTIGEVWTTIVCEFKEPFDVLPQPPGENAILTQQK